MEKSVENMLKLRSIELRPHLSSGDCITRSVNSKQLAYPPSDPFSSILRGQKGPILKA